MKNKAFNEALQEAMDAGWRSCLDHILRPDDECPICIVERLTTEVSELAAKLDRAEEELQSADAEIDALNSELERGTAEGRDLRQQLLHFAAECHRGKWSYEHDHPPAFQFLDALGERIRKSFEAAATASGRQFSKIDVPLLDQEKHQNDIGFRLQAFAYDAVDELDCECETGDYGQRHGSTCLRCAALELKTELQEMRRAAAADSRQCSHPENPGGEHLWQTHTLGDQSVTDCMYCEEPKPAEKGSVNLIERLRHRIIVDGCEMPGNDALHREAADEIERLSAVNEHYRITLQLIERDLGAEHAARQWAHDALGEHAVESAPWKDTDHDGPATDG